MGCSTIAHLWLPSYSQKGSFEERSIMNGLQKDILY